MIAAPDKRAGVNREGGQMRIDRRQILTSGAALAAMLVVGSAALPHGEHTARVGLMASGTPPRWARVATAVEAARRQQGYVEGRNLFLHRRFATYPDNAMAQYSGGR